MNLIKLKNLLEAVSRGEESVDCAMEALKTLPLEEMPFATIDHHRELRVGFPEVIFGEGKSKDQLEGIVERMVSKGSVTLITRIAEDAACSLQEKYKETHYNKEARTLRIGNPVINENHYAAVVAAGTSDLYAVEEVVETLQAFGHRAEKVIDVGVAGIHRLFTKMDLIRGAKVVIVVAGMEGALASVVGGLVDKPVIAVPTSVGYGANFGGLSALLTMLNSCASGVTVVNIDNGFGAAYAAAQILRL